MNGARLATVLAILTGFQDRPAGADLRERTTVAGGGAADLVVAVDGVTLYEGPGAKGVVEALENSAFPGLKFVVVRVDGEERVRLPAATLDKPLKVPSVAVGRAEQLSLQRESDGTTMTLRVLATTAGKEEGVDIYAGPHAPHDLVSGRDSVEVTVKGVPVWRIRRVRPAPPRPASVGVADFVARLNSFRRAAGVPAVAAKDSLHRACDLHALYLARNPGGNAHAEEPGRPGYTEEGARAAKVSVIHQFGTRRDLRDAVDSLVAAIYHRQPLLHSGLREVGVGWAWDGEGRGTVVIDVSGIVATEAGPVAYPPVDAKGVPLEFALGGRESPDPLPDPKASAGYPVSIQFDAKPRPVSAKGKLTLDGAEVPAWVSGPERPARADRPQADLVALIPKERLRPGRTYAVEFEIALEGGGTWTKAWSFTTAK